MGLAAAADVHEKILPMLRLKTEQRAITPEQAMKWLEGKIHNRAVRDSKVQEYAADMKAGRWRESHQGIAFTPDGALIDGQHRLWAIFESQCTIVMNVTHGVPQENMVVIDGGLPRTLADVIRLDDPESGVGTLHVATARSMMVAGPIYKARNPTRSEVRDFLNKNWTAISRVVSLFTSGKVRGITIAPVLAAITRATHHVSEEKIERFCTLLREGITQGEHERAAILLRNWLIDVRSGQREKGRAGRGEGNVYYLKTERAIAAFVRGEQIKMLYPASDELYPLPGEQKQKPKRRKR